MSEVDNPMISTQELACILMKKQYDEMCEVLQWASENVDRIDLYRNRDRVCVELWENLSTVPSFTAPTLYQALHLAWEARDK